jgi:hypothetical protein
MDFSLRWRRHGRARPGHPRSSFRDDHKVVGIRDKPEHDGTTIGDKQKGPGITGAFDTSNFASDQRE